MEVTHDLGQWYPECDLRTSTGLQRAKYTNQECSESHNSLTSP